MAFCTSCGAVREHEADRFCRACGRPHDAVAASDPATAVPPPTAVVPTDVPTNPPGPPPGMPPAPGTGRGGPGLRLLLAVFGTVLAVVAGAVVAWQFLWPKGGAGSPEDAARSMVEAGASQDPLALVDVIAPAEVKGLEDLVEDARDRAKDEDLIGEDKITDAVDIEVSDLEFEVDELGDDLARVTLVGGNYKVSWDPDKLPDRLAFLREESDSASESGDIAEILEDADADRPYVMTVKVGGRWYVTALGTLAEYLYQEAREYENVGRADYDAASEDLEPIVGKDPEEVIESLFKTISKGDAGDLLASMPGELGKPLLPYASIVEDALSGRYSDGNRLSLDITADNLDLETDDLGDDLVKVTIEAGTFTGTASEEGEDSDTATIEIDGRCVTGTGEAFATYDEYEGTYNEYTGEWEGGYSEQISDSQTWCFGGDDEASRMFSDLDIDAYFVVMRKVDDGYQLDPVATAAEYASIALNALDGQMIDDLIDAVKEGVDQPEDRDY